MARTESTWEEVNGSYLKTQWADGRDILINGTNKYLNFGSISGTSGYGFRDNGGTMQVKNSGGSWSDFGAGGGSFTFSTGLTDTSDTITANISTGLAGGQTIYGGTAANENLTIEGTTNATKTTSYVNLQPTTGLVGIGLTAPTAKLEIMGLGATSSTTNLRLEDSAGRSLFEVNDAGFVGISTAPSALWKLDFTGQYFQMGSDTTSNNLRTNNTNKLFGVVTPAYENIQNPTWAIGVQNTSVSNNLFIGGGVTSGANAATAINFATNSTITGGVGAIRMALSNTILRLGSGDATSTPAEVQIRSPRVSGVTDTNGVNQTYVAGLATGNANSGDHIWQSGAIGASGSTIQTATTRMTLKGATGFLGIETTTPDRLLHEEINGSATNVVAFGQRHSHITSGTAAVGFGIGEEFELENASGTNRVAGTSEYSWSDATNATENATYNLRLIRAGTLTTALSVSSTGAVTADGVAVPTISSTNTLTNKRVTKRVGTTTSSATPTINTDNVDAYHLTAQTEAITSFTTNLSGTPTDFQQLRISVTGTAARAITWGSSFANGTVALPTTTVTTTRLDVLLEWDTVTSKWRCMASGSTV